MSIATELTALQQDITDARTAITTKGGTVTAGGGSSQLATDIATIPSGETTDIVADYSGVTAINSAIRPDQNWVGKGIKKLIATNATGTLSNYFLFGSTTIEHVEIPNITTINAGAFNGCNSLTYLDARKCNAFPNTANGGALTNCSNLSTLMIDWENILSIGPGLFSGCGYQYYNLPNCTDVGYSCFSSAPNKIYVNLSSAQTISDRAFRESITDNLYLPQVTSLTGQYIFYGTTGNIIIGTTNCVAGYSNSLQGSGNIYVPASSVETYKTATNWSAYASKIYGYDDTVVKLYSGDTWTYSGSDSSIVAWDYIAVNGATCTQDSATGTTTITGVGVFEGTDESSQILVRGLNSNNAPVYCCLISIRQTQA